MPKITDEAEAFRAPELAVLSAIAHAKDPPAESSAIAITALRAVRLLDDDRARIYADLIDSRLNDAARAALEDEMQRYEPQGPWAKGHFAQGREQGHADSVVMLLTARGIAVPEEARARILACRDLPTIERWLLRAATATTATEIFVD